MGFPNAAGQRSSSGSDLPFSGMAECPWNKRPPRGRRTRHRTCWTSTGPTGEKRRPQKLLSLDTNRFDQSGHVVGQVLGGVGEHTGFRRLGHAEADVVRGNRVELVRSRPDQLVVFRAADSKTVQEKDRRGKDIAGPRPKLEMRAEGRTCTRKLILGGSTFLRQAAKVERRASAIW